MRQKIKIIVAVLALVMMGQAQAVELHRLESYTAYYDHEGELSGKGAVYCRDYCNQLVLTMDLKSSRKDLLDFNIRVIGGGAVEKSIDLIGMTIKDQPDDNYQKNIEVAKKLGSVQMVREILQDFGAVESDEMGVYNGYSCRYWDQKDFGVRLCYDADMTMVYRRTDHSGKVTSQTLTKLVEGDGGADELYEVPDGLRVIK